ncbi:hypothetical protein VTN96DRAFT_2492 [Rasamsonia emersonii]
MAPKPSQHPRTLQRWAREINASAAHATRASDSPAGQRACRQDVPAAHGADSPFGLLLAVIRLLCASRKADLVPPCRKSSPQSQRRGGAQSKHTIVVKFNEQRWRRLSPPTDHQDCPGAGEFIVHDIIFLSGPLIISVCPASNVSRSCVPRARSRLEHPIEQPRRITLLDHLHR